MIAINSATKKASVFVKANQGWVAISNALGYHTTKFIKKSFMIQVPSGINWKLTFQNYCILSSIVRTFLCGK
jgi:hypothetical protein